MRNTCVYCFINDHSLDGPSRPSNTSVIQESVYMIISYPYSLSVFVSVCLCICLSLSLCLSPYLPLSLSVSVCLFVCLKCLSICLSLSVCVCLFVCLAVCLSLFRSLSPAHNHTTSCVKGNSLFILHSRSVRPSIHPY